MPAFSGSFTGKITSQSLFVLGDQPNHTLGLGELNGIQKSADEKWNNSAIRYWATTEITDTRGIQRGYFVNDHGATGVDRGSFEGNVSIAGGQITVEGTWKYSGGTGSFGGITGGGTFKTKLTSPTDVEATWQGTYELAAARAAS
jgi:hypothetical protein